MRRRDILKGARVTGAAGGRAGRGEAKKRGGRRYYAALVARRWACVCEHSRGEHAKSRDAAGRAVRGECYHGLCRCERFRGAR